MNYVPGEVRSCTGCHGHFHRTAALHAAAPLALSRPPSIPQPQPCDLKANGGDGRAGQVIHYPSDIQPIFNAKCVSCHGVKDPAGGLSLTGEVTLYYNTSYEQLAMKELAGPLIAEFTTLRQGDQGNYNGAYLPPHSLGCAASPLIAVLTRPAHAKNAKADHSKMLTAMELMVRVSLGGQQLPILRQLFWPPASAMGQRRSEQPCLRSGRFPPQSDLRRSYRFPGPTVAPVGGMPAIYPSAKDKMRKNCPSEKDECDIAHSANSLDPMRRSARICVRRTLQVLH